STATRTRPQRDQSPGHRIQRPTQVYHLRAQHHPTNAAPRGTKTSALPANPRQSQQKHPSATEFPANHPPGPHTVTMGKRRPHGRVDATPPRILDDSPYTPPPAQARPLRTSRDRQHERHAATSPSHRSTLAIRMPTANPR